MGAFHAKDHAKILPSSGGFVPAHSTVGSSVTKAAIEVSLPTLKTWIQLFAVLVAIGIVGEVGVGVRLWVLSRRLHVIQHAEDLNQQQTIAALNKEAGDARQDAASAIERAARAEEHLGAARKEAVSANERAAPPPTLPTTRLQIFLSGKWNIRVYFLGSDDFPREAKMQAALDINSTLEAGWTGFEIGERIPLAEIARAHELVDHRSRRGRVAVIL